MSRGVGSGRGAGDRRVELDASKRPLHAIGRDGQRDGLGTLEEDGGFGETRGFGEDIDEDEQRFQVIDPRCRRHLVDHAQRLSSQSFCVADVTVPEPKKRGKGGNRHLVSDVELQGGSCRTSWIQWAAAFRSPVRKM